MHLQWLEALWPFIRTQSVRDCPHSLSLNLFRSISLHGPSYACSPLTNIKLITVVTVCLDQKSHRDSLRLFRSAHHSQVPFYHIIHIIIIITMLLVVSIVPCAPLSLPFDGLLFAHSLLVLFLFLKRWWINNEWERAIGLKTDVQVGFLSFLVCIHTSSLSPSLSQTTNLIECPFIPPRLVWTLLIITIICWTPPLPDEGRIPKQNQTSRSVFIFVVVATFHRIFLLLAFICITEDRLWPLIASVHLMMIMVILFRGNCASRNQLSLYSSNPTETQLSQ